LNTTHILEAAGEQEQKLWNKLMQMENILFHICLSVCHSNCCLLLLTDEAVDRALTVLHSVVLELVQLTVN